MSISRRGLLRQNTFEYEWALQEAWEDAHTPPVDREPAPKPQCDGRSVEFTDYRIPPSAGAAEDLCAGCPFMDYVVPRDMHLPNGEVNRKGVMLGNICRKNARLMKPHHGVWAAEVWEGGKRRSQPDQISSNGVLQ